MEINPPIITELNLENFRGIHNLTLDNLSNVNILAGANNSGKTSILEAVTLLANPDDAGFFIWVPLCRVDVEASEKRANLIRYVWSIFCNKGKSDKDGMMRLRAIENGHACSYEVNGIIRDSTNTAGEVQKVLKLSAEISRDGTRSFWNYDIYNKMDSVLLSWHEKLYSVLYAYSNAALYSMTVKFLSESIVDFNKKGCLEILQSFDPEIDDISIVREDIYMHQAKSGSLPLFAYGTGMQKALFLSAALTHVKGGVVLLDEIDNAMNISAFQDVFRWFLGACVKYGVQVFATTHSAEAMDAIICAAHENYADKDILRVITLRRDGDQTYKIIRTGEEAYTDRTVFKQEMRV